MDRLKATIEIKKQERVAANKAEIVRELKFQEQLHEFDDDQEQNKVRGQSMRRGAGMWREANFQTETKEFAHDSTGETPTKEKILQSEMKRELKFQEEIHEFDNTSFNQQREQENKEEQIRQASMLRESKFRDLTQEFEHKKE